MYHQLLYENQLGELIRVKRYHVLCPCLFSFSISQSIETFSRHRAPFKNVQTHRAPNGISPDLSATLALLARTLLRVSKSPSYKEECKVILSHAQSYREWGKWYMQRKNSFSFRKQTTTHENHNLFTDMVTVVYFLLLQKAIVQSSKREITRLAISIEAY